IGSACLRAELVAGVEAGVLEERVARGTYLAKLPQPGERGHELRFIARAQRAERAELARRSRGLRVDAGHERGVGEIARCPHEPKGYSERRQRCIGSPACAALPMRERTIETGQAGFAEHDL